MPKLYKARKLSKGLKIGLREPKGEEWFADMTLNTNKRTCRKINVPFLPKDKKNMSLAEEKAVELFNFLQEKDEKERSYKIYVPTWQTKFFTSSLLLLWLTGILWIFLGFLGDAPFGQTQILILHGSMIIPTLVSLGVLIVSHLPEGWEPTKKRKSGLLLSFILFFLVVSGFLLFYTNTFISEQISYSHSTIGLVLIPLIFWHYKKKAVT